ncbi:hypothetical protein TIFTF001_053151 [Ficus carica]|uniref:Uncharacterized protein n=1 Tax=Ficus carica TaxID=3494 RepID=A0AA88EG91_FICCA|nr:hypothetical protein TIFTF001_053151 [Ficus carica]
MRRRRRGAAKKKKKKKKQKKEGRKLSKESGLQARGGRGSYS